MANFLDYLSWRGDLPLEKVPLCDVDLLLFARLAYAPLDGIVPYAFREGVSVAAAARRVLAEGRLTTGGKRSLEAEDARFLSLLIDSPRFANLTLCGFENVFDPQREEQFAALTVCVPGGAVVAYRGTDGTLVGWKEDFNLAFSDAVPAQKHAVDYLCRAAALRGELRVCGHSKGGNLAVYAAALCPPEVQSRIRAVRNFDGPGFDARVLARPGFDAILPRTRTFVPHASIIGMLLTHEESFTVVQSLGSGGLEQHNLYLWEIARDGFIELSSLSGSSQLIDKTLKDWLSEMTREQREKVVNGLYTALQATQAETVREVREEHKLKALRAVLSLDEETRQLTLSALRILYRALRGALPNPSMRALIDRLPPAIRQLFKA